MRLNKISLLLIMAVGLWMAGCAGEQQPEAAAESPAAEDKPSVQRSSEVTLGAMVEAVDYDARTLTLKDEAGNTQTLKVRNPSVPLEKLKAGDNVKMTIYQEEVAFVAMPGAELPSDDELTAVGTAKGQSDKNITVVQANQRTSTVEAVDAASRMVTLVDADGTPLTLPVQDDVQNLDKLKPGDKVVTQTTQVVSVSIE